MLGLAAKLTRRPRPLDWAPHLVCFVGENHIKEGTRLLGSRTMVQLGVSRRANEAFDLCSGPLGQPQQAWRDSTI